MPDELRDVPPPSPEPLDGEVFDSHCHFDAMAHRAGVVERDQPAPTDYLVAAMQRATSVGVTRVINVGCAVGEWASAVASTEHPGIYGAIAIHPTEVNGITDDHYDQLEALLQRDRIVAVGETGLDYYWDRTTPQDQQRHFRRHVELAKRVGKPLMIHDRDAHADVLRILAEEGAPEAGVVFHAFSGDAAMAAECAAAGYLLSFAGVLTFKNAPALREALLITPLDQILVETDSPFLTAHPFRGRPNAPYLIPYVVRAISRLKEVPEKVVCATILGTGQRVFGLK